MYIYTCIYLYMYIYICIYDLMIYGKSKEKLAFEAQGHMMQIIRPQPHHLDGSPDASFAEAFLTNASP